MQLCETDTSQPASYVVHPAPNWLFLSLRWEMRCFADFPPSICDCRFIDTKTEKNDFFHRLTKNNAGDLRREHSLLFINCLEGSRVVGQKPKRNLSNREGDFLTHSIVSQTTKPRKCAAFWLWNPARVSWNSFWAAVVFTLHIRLCFRVPNWELLPPF